MTPEPRMSEEQLAVLERVAGQASVEGDGDVAAEAILALVAEVRRLRAAQRAALEFLEELEVREHPVTQVEPLAVGFWLALAAVHDPRERGKR